MYTIHKATAAIKYGNCEFDTLFYFIFILKSLELRKKAERSKKAKVQEEMYFDQEKQLFCEQLKAVRNALKSSQVECDMTKKDLEKEVAVSLYLVVFFCKYLL